MFRSAVVLCVLGVSAAPVSAQTSNPPGLPAVVTRGEAVLKRAPDRAWIDVSTETRDGKAAEARRKSAEAVTAITDALKRTGLAADAIRTTGYSLTPEMDWNNGRGTIRGYVVHNQLEVRVDDLDKLGDVIDAANNPKNVALSIIGPRFDLKDRQAAENEALKLAVQNAMARAQAIAAGAKRQLGQILRIEDQTEAAAPKPFMLARNVLRDGVADAAPETPITPGEIEVRVEVVLTVVIL